MPARSRKAGARGAATALLALLAALPLATVRGGESVREEHEVKAGLLVKFLKYVEWPEARLAGRDELVIGIVGEDPFDGYFAPVEGQPVLGKKLVIKRLGPYRNAPDLEPCQVVFVAASEKSEATQVLKAVEGKGVLTVGESAGFLEEGGVLNFVLAEERVAFEINQKAAADQGLHIDSDILGRAVRVVRKQ